MAPLGVNRRPAAADPAGGVAAAVGAPQQQLQQDIPAHIKLFQDVKSRLEVERQVTFEESGRAFLQAHARINEPEARQFVEDVMIGAVEIFLNQVASNVSPVLLFHFEDVFKSSARIISWELREQRSIKRLELLGKILDEGCQFYQDKKALVQGTRRVGAVRLLIARELVQDGTFTLLLQMLKGQVPILEWSANDFTPPAGKAAPEYAPLTARIISLLMTPALNARIQELDCVAFGEAAMKEVSKSFVGDVLKRQKAEDLLELHGLLAQIYGYQDETFHEFSLSLWLRCFECDAFSIKKLGLENLIRVCAEASRHRMTSNTKWMDYDRTAIARPVAQMATASGGAMSTVGDVPVSTTPSTTWDDTKVCAWLVEKRVLEILFGSGAQTHSALVGRSKNLLEHMAFAGALGPAQIDMIFESSVGQHESSRGAVQSLLAELLLDLSVAATSQLQAAQTAGANTVPETSPPILILKRATTLTAKRPEDMFFFARKLMQLENNARNRGIMLSRNPELQKALLELLWTLLICGNLSASHDEKESEIRAQQILSDFNDALRSAVVPIPATFTYQKQQGDMVMTEDRIFREFLQRCMSILQPPVVEEEAHAGSVQSSFSDDSIWTACSILKNMIQLHPDVLQQQQQQQDVIWMHTTVDRGRPEWTKKSQTEFVEELDKKYNLTDWIVHRITDITFSATTTDIKLKARLDLLRFIAERIRTYDCLTFEKARACWNALESKQALRLRWFQELVQVESGRPRVISASIAAKIFSQLICSSSMNSLGTAEGFDCFAAYFEDTAKETSLSRPPSPDADASSPFTLGIETLWTIAIQSSSPKVSSMASQMLLVMQRKLEALGRENGVAFIERLMSALKNTDSDERKRRCIKLASAYLGTQFISDSHSPISTTAGAVQNKLEVFVHHDEVITFSSDDVGKIIEKRFREKQGYNWYPGYVYDFNAVSNEHQVWFKDGDTKKYDMKTLVREGTILSSSNDVSQQSNPGSERPQFRMLSVVSDGHLRIDPKVPVKQNVNVAEAARRYHPARIAISDTTTVAQLKTMVMDQLGRQGFQNSGLEETKFEIQIQFDSTPPAVTPGYIRPTVNNPAAQTGRVPSYFRYRITNETLPLISIMARYGATFFFCYDSANHVGGGVVPSAVGAVISVNRQPDDDLELSSTVISPTTSPTSPASFICRENSPYHAELLRMIQDPSTSLETRIDTWGLLMTLPTEQGLLRKAFAPGFDWGAALEASAKDTTILGQVYILQVADRGCLVLEQQQQRDQLSSSSSLARINREDFESSLFTTKVADAIQNMFSRVLSQGFRDEWERSASVRVLIRLLTRCVHRSLVSDQTRLSRDLTKLILWDMSTNATASAIPAPPAPPSSSGHSVVVQQHQPSSVVVVGSNMGTKTSNGSSMVVTSSTTISSSNGVMGAEEFSTTLNDLSYAATAIQMDLVNNLSNHPFLLYSDDSLGEVGKTLVDVLLESPYESVRASTYRLLLKISDTNRGSVFDCVLRTLRKVMDYTPTCQNFFDFVNEFIVTGSREEIEKRCLDLMDVVRSRLVSYTYSGVSEDPTLNGFLELCKKLVEHSGKSSSTVVNSDAELVDMILSKYLLAIPSSSTAMVVAPPQVNIASSPATRQRCFALLRSLGQKSPENLSSILQRLDSFISLVDKPLARGGRNWDFNFRSEDTRKLGGSYVGLINQGATCYQNSVLQQLFMRKEFRGLVTRGIPGMNACLTMVGDRGEEETALETTTAANHTSGLSVISTSILSSSEEPLAKKKARSKKALLVQLQKLFCFLTGSEQRFYNPRLFVNHSSVLRLTDGHMSQNDCIEFYSLMMDYLEDVFKGRPEKEDLRNLCVCSMTSLTIRNCSQKHRSEKEESTFYISLSIRYGPEGRALNSLEEALDEWSKSEHLTDLICEDCFPPKPEPVAKQMSNSSVSNSSGGGGGGGAMNTKKEEQKRFEADQVKFITRFPPILVLQLKRFDFDYETLQPTKLNHRVSFEQRLDLGRFTREAVLKQYEPAVAAAAHGSEAGATTTPHVWYRLKGVVVHQGTGANFGHYYSFIEDDDKKQWYRFDDERVTPFDLTNLEEECFGGPNINSGETTKSNIPAYSAAAAAAGKRGGMGGFTPGGGSLRNYNAYLLIYSKEEDTTTMTKIEKQSLAPITTGGVPQGVVPKSLSLKFAGKLVWLLSQWKKRAQMYTECKQSIRDHELFVARENEKAMRYAIAYSPDFLQFLQRLLVSAPQQSHQLQKGTEDVYVTLGIFAVNVITRIILFAFSEKDRYESWLAILRKILARSPEVDKAVCDWFIRKILSEDLWIERLLMQCTDVRSSNMFCEILVPSIYKADPKLTQQLAEMFVKYFRPSDPPTRFAPNSQDGNFFVVLKSLCQRGDLRKAMVEKDLVLHLVRLLDENAYDDRMRSSIQQSQNQQQQSGGVHYLNDSTISTVVRDERLCAKVVFALDALLQDGDDSDELADDEDVDISTGFPTMSQESAKALFADSFLQVLVQYAPNAGKKLIAKLCDCSVTRAEKCLERFFYGLSSSQWPARASEAPSVIPDVCKAWKQLMISLDLDPNARQIREHYLTVVVKLVKEARRVAAEKKESQTVAPVGTQNYYPSVYADERKDAHRAAVILIMHVTDMLNCLALNSDPCRSVLKQLKWGWLVSASDVNSFESYIGGNERCGVREKFRGNTVRTAAKLAIALGQLPRPMTQPCFTLSYHVEDAGSVECNGLYRFDGFFPPGASETVDTVTPKFARVDPATGKRFTIFRCSATESQLWYISELSDKPGTTQDVDYYQAKDTGSGLPDGRWNICSAGIKPAPKHLIPQKITPPNPEDDLFEFFVA